MAKGEKRSNFWGEERVQLLLKYKRAKWTHSRIGAALGCTKKTVSGKLHRLKEFLTQEERAKSQRAGAAHSWKGPMVGPPPAAPTPSAPLSPAMRHLAKFDPIIGARLAREEELSK